MDSNSVVAVDEVAVETIFEPDSLPSTEDPPMEEWSSLEMVCEEQNVKRLLEEEGMYDPGTPDICPKYITLSASSVIRHVYYRYPAITDPGILTALLKPEDQVIYTDDGQDLYLTLCEQMKQCVVRCFHRGLLQNEIDLGYYGVNPNGVRAMAIALKYNKIVRRINFTDNFLNNDASYHLGDMLASNTWLVELNLSGCRIGPVGLQHLLVTMISNRTLKVLNLSRNEIGDDGMVHFANAVQKGLDVREIDLSKNKISGSGVSLLVEPFQSYNKITHWNLSWNNLFSPGTTAFLVAISETTKDLVNMNLSWNGLRPPTAWGIRKILTVRDLQNLDLCHNLLEGTGIRDICAGLPRAKKLVSLNLSFNPMRPADALRILKKLQLERVKVSQVNLENVTVDKSFLTLLEEVKRIKPNLDLKFGYIKGTFKGVGPDFRQVLFKRLDYLCKKPKKNPVDIGVALLQLHKERETFILAKEFYYYLVRIVKAPVDNDLIEKICAVFPGPKADKGERTINLDALLEYSTRMFPDAELPPTPPEPEPEPKPKPNPKGKGKGKGKGKK